MDEEVLVVASRIIMPPLGLLFVIWRTFEKLISSLHEIRKYRKGEIAYTAGISPNARTAFLVIGKFLIWRVGYTWASGHVEARICLCASLHDLASTEDAAVVQRWYAPVRQ